jgi:hypothetical protein
MVPFQDPTNKPDSPANQDYSQNESVLIQKIYTHFKKTPGTHKLGVLYVVDSVTRQWVEAARKAGQLPGTNPSDGTFAAGVNRVTELLPVLMTDIINNAPNDQKVRTQNTCKRKQDTRCTRTHCAGCVIPSSPSPLYYPSVRIVLYTLALDMQVMARGGRGASVFGGRVPPPYPGLVSLCTPPRNQPRSPGRGFPFPLLRCICTLLIGWLTLFAHTFLFHVGENQEAHRHLGAWWHLSHRHARLVPRQAERPSTE